MAGCCASGSSRRSGTRPRSTRGSTRSRWRCGTAGAGPVCARRSTACATSSGWRAGPPRPRHSPGAGRAARLVSAASRRRRSAGRTGRLVAPDGGQPRALAEAADELDLLADLAAELGAALADRPPATLADGGVIRPGYDPELDELRSLRDGGRQYIASLQQRERERTGIPSLKVGFNKVFGYYLEVTNTHAARVPADYERRQTLATAERYVTPELKEYEARVLGAEERMADPRGGAVRRLAGRGRPGDRADPAHRAGAGPARRVGRRWPSGRWRAATCGPRCTDGFDLVLKESRHPVIERMMPRESFIPNDARFTEAERVRW